MTRLAFLLMAGVCAGQPAKYSGFPSDYEQLASLFGGNSNQNNQYNNGVQDRSYARPLSFGYMSQPMGQVQIAKEPSVRANAYSSFQKMAGEQFFKSPAGKFVCQSFFDFLSLITFSSFLQAFIL